MLVVVGVGTLAVVLVLALQIDDWSRDLTTNQAATSIDASDATLRTLELPAPVDRVQEAIDQFVEQRSNWRAGETVGEGENGVSISLVRTTRFVRYADDVQVTLQPCPGGTLVDAVSQSRTGKGDLGQNPRNLRELLQALRDAF